MASISTNKKTGERTLQFKLNGERKSIWLGKMSKRDVANWKHHVEELVAAKMQGRAPHDSTSAWVGSLDPALHKKLVGKGDHGPHLVESREPAPQAARATLAAFLDGYIASHTGVKAGTREVYGHVLRNLVDYFGADQPLAAITVGDANAFREWLKRPESAGGQALAESTARRRCGFAKQFFADAVDHELIDSNPFGKMKKLGVQANRSRDYFLSREDAAKVLDACPDAQSRLVFALARYGGLRTPSETMTLRWGDVDWERGRMTVTSPKTERHEGKASRVIPIFPELRPYLEQAWDEAEPGTEFVVTIHRDHEANLRSNLALAIRRAGLKQWPKLFQNLRANRETELAGQFPTFLVCEWIGNSAAVAQKHYLQVTDADFAKATSTPTGPVHIPMQTVADTSGQETTGKPPMAETLGKRYTSSSSGGLVMIPNLRLPATSLVLRLSSAGPSVGFRDTGLGLTVLEPIPTTTRIRIEEEGRGYI